MAKKPLTDDILGFKGSMISPLTDAVVAKRASRDDRNDGFFHASQLLGLCARRTILERVFGKTRVPPGTNLQRRFDIGTAAHKLYQEQYWGPGQYLWGLWRCSRCHQTVTGFMPTDSCPTCQWGAVQAAEDCVPMLTASECRERCFSDAYKGISQLRDSKKVAARHGCVYCGAWGSWEYLEVSLEMPVGGEKIVGKADAVFRFPDTGRYILADIKTSASGPFNRVSDKASAGYTHQVQMYLGMLNAMYPKFEIEIAHIFFINKDNSFEKEVVVEYDPALFRAVVASVKAIDKAWRSPKAKLPKRLSVCQSTMDDRPAKCSMTEQCFHFGASINMCELREKANERPADGWDSPIAF